MSQWELEQLGQYMTSKLQSLENQQYKLNKEKLNNQPQMPCISTIFGKVLSGNHIPEVSTCGSRSHNESSYDMGELP